MIKKDFLNNKFKKNNIHLSDKQQNQFLAYYELLIEKNKVMNLTAITDFEEVVVKHFVDSISLIRVVNLSKVSNIIDVGTGAGFPGIPLKIVFPEIDLVLLDSLNKRIKFLNDVINVLQLNTYPKENSIVTIHGRAEDLGRDSLYREKFDLCVSRAVANLATLSEYCLPFVKKGGAFISYKSGNVDDELTQGEKSIKVLGGTITKVDKFQLADTDIERSLILISKNDFTPKKYPRLLGKPKKEPIVW